MQLKLTLGSLTFLAVCVGTIRGDTYPHEATVVVPEVEVRSLHSAHENSYPTSKLRQGATVTVVGEKDGGWLAIKPPAGSFSWISTKHLKMEQATSAIVQEDGVEVRIGSSLVGKKPNVRQVRLDRGAKVMLLKDKAQTDDDGTTWVMIQPPATEVRFIPREAIKPTQLATAEPPMGSSSATPAGRPEPNIPQNADPSWAEAERAEREGRMLDAERLYSQLAKQTTDNDLRILCHNRIHMIHQANRRAAAGYQPAPNQGNRLAPTTTSRPLNSAPARPSSQYTHARENPAVPQTRGPGLLARSNVPVGGQQGYLLDMGKGQPVLYVVPQTGVNLEPHVGQQVSVTGPVEYHSGYRQNVLRATQVTPR